MTTQPWPAAGRPVAGSAPPPRRLSTVEAVLLGIALLWSVVVAVGAFLVPLGTTVLEDDTGLTTTLPSPTVAEQSGLAVVICLIPLLVTITVGALLARRGAGLPSLVAAWVALGVLGLAILAGLLSIGLFLVPAAACLFAALLLRSAVGRPAPRPTSGFGGAPSALRAPPA